jgi:hypothetical protein
MAAWHWTENGTWSDAEIHLVNFPNRFPELSGQNLYLWLYAPQGIAAADLPDLILSDASRGSGVRQTYAARFSRERSAVATGAAYVSAIPPSSIPVMMNGGRSDLVKDIA